MPKASVPSSYGGIKFDAVINRDRTLSSEIPEYPVEDGFPVSDAVLRKPIELSVTAFVSNTPVTWKSHFGNTKNRVNRVVRQLESLWLSGQPHDLITGGKVYRDMAIASITIPETPEMLNAVEIPISFKQVEVTRSKTTTIPSSYGMSGTTGDSGGSASTETVKDEGFLKKASSVLFGFFNK